MRPWPKDYYQVLGVARRRGPGRYQEGLPQARPQVPSRPQSRAISPSEAKFKEIQEAYCGPQRPEEAGPIRPIRLRRRDPARRRPGRAPAARDSRVSIFPITASSLFRDFFENLFGGGGRRGAEAAAMGPETGRRPQLHYDRSASRTPSTASRPGSGSTGWPPATAAAAAAASAGSGQATCPTCRRHRPGTRPARLHEILGRLPGLRRLGPGPRGACPACRRPRRWSRNPDLIAVRIPAGVDTGSKVRDPRARERRPERRAAGRPLHLIEVAPHAFFRREGANISRQGADHGPRGDPGGQDRSPDALGKDDDPHPARHEIGSEVPHQGAGRAHGRPEGRGATSSSRSRSSRRPFDDERVRELMKELERDLRARTREAERWG